MIDNDCELVDRFLTSNDQEAFNELVRRHERKIRAVATSVLGSTPDVEDVLQETFVQFIQKAHPLRDPERLSAWLHGVAWRLSTKAAQQRYKLSLEKNSEALSDPSQDWVEAQELEQILLSCLQNLPVNYRQVIELSFYKDETNDEIAKKLAIPRGSIAGFLKRGLRLLRTEVRARNISASILAMAWVSSSKLQNLSGAEISAVSSNCLSEASRQSGSASGSTFDSDSNPDSNSTPEADPTPDSNSSSNSDSQSSSPQSKSLTTANISASVVAPIIRWKFMIAATVLIAVAFVVYAFDGSATPHSFRSKESTVIPQPQANTDASSSCCEDEHSLD